MVKAVRKRLDQTVSYRKGGEGQVEVGELAEEDKEEGIYKFRFE